MRLLANFRSNALREMTGRKISVASLARTMGREYKGVYDILYNSTDVKLRYVEEVRTALKVDPIAMMEE